MDKETTRPARRRARKPDGKFQENRETNQAWEPTPIEDAIGEKTVDYSIKQKVSGPSEPSAGKYGKKDKVRPTFGNVYTTYH